MNNHRLETSFFIAALAITIFLAWLILMPYVSTLVLAVTLAFLFHPLYRKLLHVFRYEAATALSTVIIATFIVFVPLGFFIMRILGETTALYTTLTSHGGFDFGAALTDFLRTNFESFHATEITFNFDDYIRQGLLWLLQNLGAFLSGIAQIFFTAFLSLLGMFYFLKDGERLKKWMLKIVPLSPEYTEEIMREMEAAGSSVIKGTLIVAIIRGIVMGAGFFLFHIPNYTFWGALVAPISIIPIIGTWLIVIPAIAYLFLTGQTFWGIGLVIWSLILINLIDNVLSPQLIHRGANIHPYLVLLSVIGGLGFFGPVGFLVGPLVMALLFSLLKIYPKLVAERS